MTSNIATDLVLFTDTCILLKNVTSDNIHFPISIKDHQYREKIAIFLEKINYII